MHNFIFDKNHPPKTLAPKKINKPKKNKNFSKVSLKTTDNLPKHPVTQLRQNPTQAEQLIWYHLRAKRFNGYKFRRQHQIYPFIVDFVCLKRKLIIELDGGQHATRQAYDQRRTEYLESKGYKLIRFWNNTVLNQTREVLESIYHCLSTKNLNRKNENDVF